MQDKIEGIIRKLYRRPPARSQTHQSNHPDEEILACYLEGRLSEEEAGHFKRHVLECKACARKLAANIEALEVKEEEVVPESLLKEARKLLGLEEKGLLLEIILKVKEKMLEVISTTGEVLVGQELVSAPLLRSRNIKDFKDEVTIFKDFKDMVVELKIENKGAKFFDVAVVAKKKDTHNAIKDLRVTLFKEATEVESYIASSGLVTFEHVLLGRYRIEISDASDRLASVAIDIKT